MWRAFSWYPASLQDAGINELAQPVMQQECVVIPVPRISECPCIRGTIEADKLPIAQKERRDRRRPEHEVLAHDEVLVAHVFSAETQQIFQPVTIWVIFDLVSDGVAFL